jgi:hypothetical protein
VGRHRDDRTRRPHHRAGRDDRRRHRHRDDRGNRLQLRHRRQVHQHRHRHRRRGIRRHRRRRDDRHRHRLRHRDAGRHRDADPDAVHRDRAHPLRDAGACCQVKRHRDGDRHRDAGRRRDAAAHPAGVAPDARRAAGWRTGCYRRAAGAAHRAWDRRPGPGRDADPVWVPGRAGLRVTAPTRQEQQEQGQPELLRWLRVPAVPREPAAGWVRAAVPRERGLPAWVHWAGDPVSEPKRPLHRENRHWSRAWGRRHPCRRRACRHPMTHEDAARRVLPPSTTPI